MIKLLLLAALSINCSSESKQCTYTQEVFNNNEFRAFFDLNKALLVDTANVLNDCPLLYNDKEVTVVDTLVGNFQNQLNLFLICKQKDELVNLQFYDPKSNKLFQVDVFETYDKKIRLLNIRKGVF